MSLSDLSIHFSVFNSARGKRNQTDTAFGFFILSLSSFISKKYTLLVLDQRLICLIS